MVIKKLTQVYCTYYVVCIIERIYNDIFTIVITKVVLMILQTIYRSIDLRLHSRMLQAPMS